MLRVASALALLGIVGAWVVTLRPQSLGGPATYVVIRGDSMEPNLHTGDLVILQAATTYAHGDVVGYRVPAGDVGAGHLVVHRIDGGTPESGFRMKGDNNASIDPWLPDTDDIAGRVWIALPAIGRMIAVLHQPSGIAALVATTIVVVGLFLPSSFGRSKRGARLVAAPAALAARAATAEADR